MWILLYDNFIKALVAFDSRNQVEKCTRNLENTCIPEIYKKYDFINVEVPCGFGNVKFYPLSKLNDLKIEYSYVDADCIFATNNGEPIFIKDSLVYTCICGKEKIFYEKIAGSFDEFIEKIMNE